MNQIAIINGEKLLAYSFGRIPGLMTLTVYIALVLILVFFLLKDWYSLGQGIKSFLPARRGAMEVIWAEMDMQLANYLRGKAVEIVIVGVASYVVFALFGLRYSLLLAVIVGFSVITTIYGGHGSER
jgi:putative permease